MLQAYPAQAAFEAHVALEEVEVLLQSVFELGRRVGEVAVPNFAVGRAGGPGFASPS